MSDYRNEDNELVFEETAYDLEGLLRLVDSEEAAMELMYYDADDDKHYRNRYDMLECERGIRYILDKVEYYLESDEDNSLFIAIAAVSNGSLTLFDGRRIKAEDVNIGEVELGNNLVYGVLVKKSEDHYVFSEVVYHDGEEISQSWIEIVEDAGILTKELERLIVQFGE